MKFIKDFDLEVFFSKYEFAVKHNIGGSDLQSLTVAELMSQADDRERRGLEELYLGYTETYGAPELRRAIAGTYETLAPENILCFSGAEEGIFAVMNALLEPDDHALVVIPNYQSAETIPLGLCQVTGVPLDPDNDWALDLDFVKDHIRPNTKLVSVNFPHNPTGKIIAGQDYADLVELCRAKGIYLFSDEVYRGLERDPAGQLPQGADVYEKAISLNVMSKAYGLAGLRIGWAASQDKALLQKAERIKHYLTICSSAPSEYLTLVALNHRDWILARNRKLVADNLARLNEFMAGRDDLFDWNPQAGGCISYPRYLGPGRVEEFTDELVRELGVLLLPATVFQSDLGPTPTDRFRIGFGRADFAEALALVNHYLDRH